ncbi:MAG: DUF2796 domain-containing protein [Pseudomonadota bacterium]|nr:DUF2796 domain-containing protein [Pseudomonadota bacterium]
MKNLVLGIAVLCFTLTSKVDDSHHVHGRGQARIKITGDKVAIKLKLPVHNIIGFERQPKSKAQRQELVKAEAMLLQVDNVVKLAPISECELASKKLTVKRFKKKKNHEHADFMLSYKFRCLRPSELNEIQFVVFDRFVKLQNIDVLLSYGAKGGTKSAKTEELTRQRDTLQIVKS